MGSFFSDGMYTIDVRKGVRLMWTMCTGEAVQKLNYLMDVINGWPHISAKMYKLPTIFVQFWRFCLIDVFCISLLGPILTMMHVFMHHALHVLDASGNYTSEHRLTFWKGTDPTIHRATCQSKLCMKH